jgi:uncharacterized protein (TIGR03083 family)
MSNREAHALVAAVEAAGSSAPTACAGWTVHELVAHLAAGSKEIADLVEAHLHGRSARPTRAFEEREAPYRAMAGSDLRRAWMVEGGRLIEAVAALDALGPDAAIDFTGTSMTATHLRIHARSEAAIHRWDLCGDDATSDELLAQPELTAHATWALSAMPVLSESAASRTARAPRLRIVLRAPDRPDVLLADGRFTSPPDRVPDAGADALVETDAAHRLLVMWGRRAPGRPLRITPVDPTDEDLVTRILWPQV